MTKFSNRRCDECRRRKKRCHMPLNTSRCDYCSKKDIPCVYKDEGLQIMHYNPNSGGMISIPFSLEADHPLLSMSRTGDLIHKDKFSTVHIDQMSLGQSGKGVKRRRESASRNALEQSENVTTSSLISAINSTVKTYLPTKKAQQEHSCKSSMAFTKMAKLYLPKISEQGNFDSPVFDEELVRSSVPETLKIPEEISLTDFLFSSTRIHSLDEDPAKLLNFALGEIKSFLDNDKQSGDVIDVLRERGYLVSTESPDANNPQLCLKKRRTSITEGLTPVKSFDEVDFTVNVPNLSTDYFVEKAGITLEDGKRKFCDVIGDGSLNEVISTVLFNQFCGITPIDKATVEQTTPDEKMTSPPENHDSSTTISRSYLSVVLPLVAGNATVLKASMLLGYYHWMQENPDDMLSVLSDDMHRLHLEVVTELQERLTNTTSLCCDHTIMCTILLLNLEHLLGFRSSLWQKLLVLLHNLIKFRGGVKELTSTLTGMCLLRIMSGTLCMGMLSFVPESMETHEVINLIDFAYLLDTKPHYQFYDMVNTRPDLVWGNMKELLRSYANVFQMHNLSGISYFANMKDPDGERFGDYGSVSVQNLEYAVTNSEKLAKQIVKTIETMNMESMQQKYQVQYKFALKSSLLCLYQMVFRFNSLTPKTVLMVRDLLVDVESVFAELEQLSNMELKDTLVFVLPLFVLGVDIVSQTRRAWYKENMEKLYERSKKECLKTCLEMLKAVWDLNVTGLTYIDSKMTSQQMGYMLPFCA
ncbi:CYFA0S39e00342g1_1 [Cyberlindnera fabianii]|uniref:CYFA0S39e00342g1_1 n=1 Tax=Cyberlindnera fabianii TaxID=36022 RepID=A0A061BLH1_CYBFA|nr:CYFA0S39e00342g1_1 [Cyberlindnera fabianii]